LNDGMSSEHFFWNVQIHTVFSYAKPCICAGLSIFVLMIGYASIT
jgi:hypothetical protein